ncbi:MAG: hypothetical protein ACOVO9_03810 [Bacteroidia bacterium]
MVKKQFSYLFLLIVLLGAGACKKTVSESSESNLPLTYSDYLKTEAKEPVDGVISLQSFSNRDNHLTNVSFFAEARFFENGENSKLLNVGDVKIGGLNLIPDSKGTYKTDTIALEENQEQFGRNIRVEISGNNGFNTFLDSIYSPEKIVYDTFCICSGQHIRKAPFPVRWNQDLNNKEVQLVLVYDGISSSSRTQSMPSASYALPVIKAEDLGTYEIQPKTFYNFLPASFIKIYLGRKNSKIIQVSGKRIRLESITWTTRKLDLMY